MKPLTPAEQIALACALSDKIITEQKRGLPDNSAETVDVTVHVTGTVTKGQSTPGGEREEVADVNWFDPVVVMELLSRLGIGDRRLRVVLENVVADLGKAGHDAVSAVCFSERPKLAREFDNATAAAQAKLPTHTVDVAGRTGRVSVTGNVTVASRSS